MPGTRYRGICVLIGKERSLECVSGTTDELCVPKAVAYAWAHRRGVVVFVDCNHLLWRRRECRRRKC